MQLLILQKSKLVFPAVKLLMCAFDRAAIMNLRHDTPKLLNPAVNGRVGTMTCIFFFLIFFLYFSSGRTLFEVDG